MNIKLELQLETGYTKSGATGTFYATQINVPCRKSEYEGEPEAFYEAGSFAVVSESSAIEFYDEQYFNANFTLIV